MLFKRKLYARLLEWKGKPNRKPLIIRGARQVGKSTLIRDFSKEYDHFIELNLEKEKFRKLFEENDEVKDILDLAFLLSNTPGDNKKATLLFVDEIQESPAAIKKLRYFYEEFPDLHVIAAGSLLELAIQKIASFPVGRVEQEVLQPFDFEEFLMACGLDNYLVELNHIPYRLHMFGIMIEKYHEYAIIGGMPEIIKQFVADKSYANLGPIYNNLWQAYMDDAEKYAKNQTERKVLRHVFHTAALEKDRISFAGFGNSNYRSREVGEALKMLDMSRVIRLVYPSTSTKPPMNEDIKKRPRLQFVDTGLLNYILGIQAEMIGLDDLTDYYQGRIIQHLATQEIMAQVSNSLYKPRFWVREKKGSSAEVDLLYQQNNHLIPVEIKSGKQGKLRSLHQFMEETSHPYAIRMLANNFSIEEAKTPSGKQFFLMNLPYFLSSKIPEYTYYLIR